ncbi:hypothetical protein BASA81_013563 [Batrachochytrium salamandrivorans]|nr:hypothetical protein BASA81_013563 [Batrachochytrium salamandrivorans]
MLVERGLNGCCYTSAMTTLNQTNMSFDVNVTVVSLDIVEATLAPVITVNFPWEFQLSQTPVSEANNVVCQPPTYIDNAQINCTTNDVSRFSALFNIVTAGVPTTPLSVYLMTQGNDGFAEQCVFATSCSPPNEGPRVPLTLPPLPGDNTEARSPATGTDTNSTQPGGYPSYNSSYLPANQISAIVFSVVFGVLIMIFIMMIICWRRQYRQELQEEALYRKGVLYPENSDASLSTELTTAEQLLAAQIADRLAAQYGGDQRVLSTPSKPMTQLHSSRINSSSAISHNSGKLDDRQITHTTSSGPSSTSSSYTEQLPPSVRHSIIQFGDLLDQFQMPQGREMAIPNGNSSSSMGFDMRRVSHSSIRLKDTDVSRRKSAIFSMPSEPFKAISPLVETSDWAESPCSGEETPEHRPSAQQGSQTSTLVRDSTNNTKPGDTVSPLRLLSSAINSPSLTQRSSDSNSTTTSLLNSPHTPPSVIAISVPTHPTSTHDLFDETSSDMGEDDSETPISTPLLNQDRHRE